MSEITKIYKFSYYYDKIHHGKIVIDEFDVIKETDKTYQVHSPTCYERVIRKTDIGVLWHNSFILDMFLTEKDRKKFVSALKGFYNDKVQKKESELKKARAEYQAVKGLN